MPGTMVGAGDTEVIERTEPAQIMWKKEIKISIWFWKHWLAV